MTVVECHVIVAQDGLPAAFENLKERISTWEAIRTLTDFKLNHVIEVLHAVVPVLELDCLRSLSCLRFQTPVV